VAGAQSRCEKFVCASSPCKKRSRSPTELLDDVVHDKIDVDLRFAAHALLVGFAKLTNLTDVKSLVGIQLEHSHDDAAELRRIFLA